LGGRVLWSPENVRYDSVTAATVATAHTIIDVYSRSKNGMVSGSRKTKNPVILFSAEWSETSILLLANP